MPSISRSFKTPQEVYIHACQVHCPVQVDELGCLWERCDGLKRRRFSMMTHLMDRHCNDEVIVVTCTFSLFPRQTNDCVSVLLSLDAETVSCKKTSNEYAG